MAHRSMISVPSCFACLQDYDLEGKYIKTWVPELKNVSSKRVHEPWLMSQSEQQQFGVSIGQDYPTPVPSSQLVRPHGSKLDFLSFHHACVHARMYLLCCTVVGVVLLSTEVVWRQKWPVALSWSLVCSVR